MFAQFQDYLCLDPQEAVLSPVLWYSLLLVLFLCLVWGIVKKTRSELVSVFCDDEGAVQITPQALRELVRKSCATIPGVHSPSTKIFKKSGEVRLLVQLHVEPDCKVKTVRSQLQEKLEVVMVNNLNFTNFSGVDIIIKGFQDIQ